MSEHRKAWTILHEPTLDQFFNLLNRAEKRCKYFSLILRPVQESRPPAGVLEKLERFALVRREVGEWPGTSTGKLSHGTLLTYGLDHAAVATICDINNRLYGWRMFDYPEDLCVYRADGTVWLGSIAHERDSFLVLTEKEAEELVGEVPGLMIRADPAEQLGDLASKIWIGA